MISRIQKHHFITTLITLLITLQTSTAAIAANINSGKHRDTNNNYTAVIKGTDSARIKEDDDPDNDNLLEASGKLSITDHDAGEAAFIATVSNGNYGNLIIAAAGNWYYAADNTQPIIQNLTNSDSLKETLTVSSIDGTTHPVVITIKGVNETNITDNSTTDINNPAVISGSDSGSVTEDVDPDGDNLLEVSGKLNISDSDSGEAAFIAKTVNGNYGSLTINATGSWNYAASNSQSTIQNLASGAALKDNLTVSSVDGTTHTISITINGADDITVADIHLSWVAPAEREDNSSLSLSEIVGYKVYYGSMQGQYANNVNINDGSAEGYTFTGLSAGTYYFVITTIDTDGRESQYSAAVKVDL